MIDEDATAPLEEEASGESEEVAKEEPAEEPVKQETTTEVDWRSTITDEKLHAQSERFASPQEMLKAINKLQGDVSSRIKTPGEDASDEDIEKFRAALGVPETVEGYEVKPPEGTEFTEVDELLLEPLKNIAFERGISADALQGLVQEFMTFQSALQEDALQQLDDFQKQSLNDLHTEWGAEREKNTNIVTQMVAGFTDNSLKDLMESTVEGQGRLGDHPAMMRFLVQIGRTTQEGEVLIGASPTQRADIQTQITELEGKYPIGTEAYATPAVQAQFTALYDRLHGKTPIVGAEGRAA